MKSILAKLGLIIITLTIIFGFKTNDLIISNLSHNNYEVTQLMMRQQYVDRKYKIQKFPSFLLGAKLIKTANDDKSSNGDEFLTFDVNTNVSVFVAHWSKIKETPKWLKDSFEKTDLILNSGEEDYILYKKDYFAGKVVLGGNIELAEEDHAMYSVIVAEKLDIPDIVEYAINDFKTILINNSTYKNSFLIDIPSFKYQDKNDSILVQLRKDLNLDSITKGKDEITQIIDLMKWVNKRVEHNGSKDMFDSRSIKIIEGFDKTGVGVNCRAMSTILNDVYLAMGFRARIIHCMPHEDYDTESHVTNLVYSQTLSKWIYMDPSFCAYITNENGLILNHSEIRKYFINGDRLIVEGGLIHNGEPYGGGQDYYLKYMSKNLFRFSSPLISKYGYEYSNPDKIYINLNPSDYKDNIIDYNVKTQSNRFGCVYYIQNDEKFFKIPID